MVGRAVQRASKRGRDKKLYFIDVLKLTKEAVECEWLNLLRCLLSYFVKEKNLRF